MGGVWDVQPFFAPALTGPGDTAGASHRAADYLASLPRSSVLPLQHRAPSVTQRLRKPHDVYIRASAPGALCKFLSQKNNFSFAAGVPQTTGEIKAELLRQMAHDKQCGGGSEAAAEDGAGLSRGGGGGGSGAGDAGGGAGADGGSEAEGSAALMKDNLTQAELSAYLMASVQDTFLPPAQRQAVQSTRAAEERRLIALAQERAGLKRQIMSNNEQVKDVVASLKVLQEELARRGGPQICAACKCASAPVRCSKCRIVHYCDVQCQKVCGSLGSLGTRRMFRRRTHASIPCPMLTRPRRLTGTSTS